MTYEVFENAIKEALIKTYIEEYGEEAWTSQTAEKKSLKRSIFCFTAF